MDMLAPRANYAAPPPSPASQEHPLVPQRTRKVRLAFLFYFHSLHIHRNYFFQLNSYIPPDPNAGYHHPQKELDCTATIAP